MKENNSKAYLMIMLEDLTAIEPLITDKYITSLPTMTGYLDTNTTIEQN